MKATCFRLFVLAALLPGIVLAAKDSKAKKKSPAPAASESVEVLKPFDKNGNQQIDSDELASVQQTFAALRKLDKNSNGTIEPTEVEAPKPAAESGRMAKARESFQKVDTNGNHKIDAEEIESLQKMLAGGKMMTRLDKNGNGKLEPSEVEMLNERVGQMIGGKAKGSAAAPNFRKPPEKPAEAPAPTPKSEEKKPDVPAAKSEAPAAATPLPGGFGN